MDYDDQMIYAKTILENYPDILAHFQDAFPYICVDEAQDTSKIHTPSFSCWPGKPATYSWSETRIRVSTASGPPTRTR